MQTNDYVSVSTTDVPAAVKTAGTEVKEAAAKPIESKSEESGETAEIQAQDAIETDDHEAEADDKDIDAGDDDQKDSSEEEEKAKPKKKGGFQKKLERKDREIEFLREQLMRQQQPQQPEKPAEKTVAKDTKPKSEDFESHSDYIEALTDWKVEQKAQELTQKSQQEAVKSAYKTKLDEFQAKTKDFAKSVEDYQDVIDDASDVMIPVGLQEAILESDAGPEILYTLAKNKTELMRISKLSLVAQAKEIGKLEAKLAKPEEKKPEVKTKTAAPPPPKPVGTKSPGKVVKDPSEMTPDEYIAYRRGKK